MKEVNVFQTDKISFKDGILHGHNQDAYQKMRDALKYGNRAFIEHATGTGKSYLAIKLLKDVASRSDKKVLYVTSQKHLIHDFELMCKNVKKFSKVERDIDLEATTYASLNKRVEEHFDLIIFDEAQYMGAKKWGQAAETILKNNPDAKVVGMSATPERLDGKDVVEEFFEGVITSHLPIDKAMAKEILSVPNYWITQYKFDKNSKTDDEIFIEDSLVEFKERLLTATPKEKEKIEQIIDDLYKAQRAVAQTPELPTIFEQILSTEKLKTGKFIVFCPYAKIGEDFNEDDILEEEQYLDKSLANMKKFMEKAPEWFGALNGKAPAVYGMHSKFSNKYNEENLTNFINDKSKNLRLMYSINMLTLGKHIKDLDGIIMLRPTASKSVFYQQLGRVLSVKGVKNPLVIDIVGNLNYSDFEIIKDFEDEVNQEIEKEYEEQMQRKAKKQPLVLFKVRAVNQSTMELVKTLRENVEGYTLRKSFGKIVNYLNQYLALNPDHIEGPLDSDASFEMNGKVIEIGKTLQWLKRTIIAKSKITGIDYKEDYRKKMLDEILPGWDEYNPNYKLQKFKENVLIPLKFYKEKNSITKGPIPADTKVILHGQTYGIGPILYRLGTKENLNKADEIKISLLDQELPEWNNFARREAYRSIGKNQERFKKVFYALQKFMEENNHNEGSIPVRTIVEIDGEDVQVGQALYLLNKKRINGDKLNNLEKSVLKILDDNIPGWNKYPTKSKTFEEATLIPLSIYQKQHNHYQGPIKANAKIKIGDRTVHLYQNLYQLAAKLHANPNDPTILEKAQKVEAQLPGWNGYEEKMRPKWAKEEKFELRVVEPLKKYMTDNNHTCGPVSTNASVDVYHEETNKFVNIRIGMQLYRLSLARKGLNKIKQYGEEHCQILDQLCPGWDQYRINSVQRDKNKGK